MPTTHDSRRGIAAGAEPERIDALGPVRVAEVMSTPVRTIAADADLAEAQRLLGEAGTHHLLVEDRGSLVAILSDRDVLRHVSPYAGSNAAQRRDDDTLRRRVYQAATYQPVTIHLDATVQEAAARMLDRGISALPVVDRSGDVVGIVTARDLLRAMLTCPLPSAQSAAGARRDEGRSGS